MRLLLHTARIKQEQVQGMLPPAPLLLEQVRLNAKLPTTPVVLCTESNMLHSQVLTAQHKNLQCLPAPQVTHSVLGRVLAAASQPTWTSSTSTFRKMMLAYLGLSLRFTKTGPIIWEGPHLHGNSHACMAGLCQSLGSTSLLLLLLAVKQGRTYVLDVFETLLP